MSRGWMDKSWAIKDNPSKTPDLAKPTTIEKLRAEIRAAGERLVKARRKGWITDTQEKLQEAQDEPVDEV